MAAGPSLRIDVFFVCRRMSEVGLTDKMWLTWFIGIASLVDVGVTELGMFYLWTVLGGATHEQNEEKRNMKWEYYTFINK